MRNLLLVTALLAATTAPACVYNDGRNTTSSGSSSAVELAPDIAQGAAALGAVALCIGFLYLQAGH